MKRFIALVLALAMLLSLVSCGKKTPAATDVEKDDVAQKVEETVVNKTDDTAEATPIVEMAPVDTEPDRETLEKIADMVGIDEGEDVSSMDEDTLKDLIYSELDKEAADLTPTQDAVTGDNPAVDSTVKEEYYEEDGSMNQPFDVIYPELVANGEVEYAKDALLLKISNAQGDAITSGMESAGVAKLEVVIPAGDYTWHKASLTKDTDISAAVTELRALSEIETVDYDYVVETTAMDEYKELPSQFNSNQRDRWEHHHCGVHDAYKELKSPGGSSNVIVAVIDTGVDYTHEDLKQNIWVNSAETPDDGIDNDGNGYVDDYYGVDVVAGSGSGDDDHGHGTHVAGIIAAQNNNLGVVGLAYNCKVMPIKAGNHSGYFLQSDIAKAVYYAAQNGAEVINMSFGGTACSQAVQDALAEAYASCVLVAAAGNDGAPNEPIGGLPGIPNYPAALSYVVGVMSIGKSGVESSFSNWDVEAFNGVEYEVYAPGVDIISTIPNNGYAAWSGTSMAAPYVSAIAAILRSEYTDRDTYPTKFIYGQICSTSEDTATCLDPEKHGYHNRPMIVNLYDALTKLPKPNLGVTDFAYFDTVGMTQDTAGKNTGDGVADAGETLALGLTLRNRWGMSENTVVKIDTLSSAGISDPYIEILNDKVDYGSVGTYSTQDCGRIYTDEIITGWEKPFYIKIANDCPNDYMVAINITITAENGLDEKDNATYTFEGKVSFAVRNGKVLPSVIEEDMTLTKDNLYIVQSGVLISEGVTVTAEAGTHIQFYTTDANDPYASTYIPKLTVAGAFITDGTEENPVYIYPSDLFFDYMVFIETTGIGYVAFDGADITNFGMVTSNSGKIDNQAIFAKNSVFRSDPSMDRGGNLLFYYRYLSGSKVYTSHKSSLDMRGLRTADACTFYELLRAECCTTFTDCIFVDSYMYAAPFSVNAPSFQNCLFLGNYYESTNGKHFASVAEVPNYGEIDVLYSRIVSPEGAEKNYLLLLTTKSFPITYIDEYFASKGIYRAKTETQTEWEQLINGLPANDSGYAIAGYDLGIQFDPFSQNLVWTDGSKVGDWLTLEEISPSYKYCRDDTNNTVVSVKKTSVAPVIYELPTVTASDEENWSAEAIVASLTEDLQHINTLFTGNAVLNRISTETNVEKWLRVQAEGDPGETVQLGGNYWGTTNESAMELQMIDGRDYSDYAMFDYDPYLTTPPELVFPYVTGVTILDKSGDEVTRVGSEEITVRVTFSRDMNTDKPVEVAFGSSKPYRDYIIEGDFVDERTWEGTYTVSTVIGNGYQYFSIGGGEADNGKDLYTDWARFAFEIDTTAAQAMIMQGSATEEGITLTWMQDDFDTLMGYNVYRSTALDGQYQRLNSSVIPADTKTFFDDTVEPGKEYFYNFTVVKTDLSESEPSGKITIWSLDTMAPNVYHSVVPSATMGSNLVVSATVTDNLQIDSVKVMYRTTGTEEYKAATMNKQNDKYIAIIPAEDLDLAGLEYYIDAFDGISHTYKGSADEPYSVTVLQPTTTSDLGDVDGDGVITLVDALMVLKAKNHKLNLDAAQFVRADLDGNGELEAKEALRILQYATGTVGSILG